MEQPVLLEEYTIFKAVLTVVTPVFYPLVSHILLENKAY